MRFMRKSAHRSRWVAMLALVLLVATGCGDSQEVAQEPEGGDDTERGTVVVGSTNFSEQEIVAEMYALVLEDAGYTVERRFQLGSREVVLPALEQGEIDLYPEYVGTALEFLSGGAGEATSDTAATTEKLRERFADKGVAVLEPAPAQDRNGLVVTQETADRLGLETVSDLEAHAGELVFGGPPECPQRPLCLQGYEEAYGLEFAEFRPLDAAGPVTWAALENGDIDVALMFTTQGVIEDKGWVLLEEDAELQPAENIVPVIREEVLTDEIADLLDGVSARLTTEAITALNREVDAEAADPRSVAEAWLQENGLIS
ncbi:MAG TPA: ABC transporter substrate-binding protein [Egibacteraceae bacterium]|nr:ABC transporter substrate-binding protein [Egibacteraceae bacterium]